MRHRIKLHETECVVDIEQAVQTDSRVTETRCELGWEGLHSRRAAAVVTRELHDDILAAPELTLHATLARGNASVRGVNRHVIGMLNHMFDMHYPPHEAVQGKRAWLAEVSRSIDTAALQRLAEGGSGPQSSATGAKLALARIADRTGVSAKPLKKFIRRVGAASAPAQQAHLAQKFVQKNGVAGIAALHGLLGNDSASLRVKLTHSGYQDASDAGRRLALKYSGPDTRSRKAPREQQDELAQGILQVRRAHRDIQANPLLPGSDRGEMLHALAATHRQLAGAAARIRQPTPAGQS